MVELKKEQFVVGKEKIMLTQDNVRDILRVGTMITPKKGALGKSCDSYLLIDIKEGIPYWFDLDDKKTVVWKYENCIGCINNRYDLHE